MTPNDRWFALIAGIAFIVFSGWIGRELATKLEGPSTAEERVSDALRRRLVFRVIGGALIVFAIWKFVA